MIVPGPADGTSFYRALGPFGYVSRECGVNLIEYDEWDWTKVIRCDAVFIQRPFTAPHVMVAKHCKAMNVPLWVDYDDLYSAFPDWCPNQQQIYGNPTAVENMKRCVEMADAITVSTAELGRQLSSRAQVIPNALNGYLWGFSTGPRQKVITWRGSGGHDGDVDTVFPQLQAFTQERPEWAIHLLGKPNYRFHSIGTVHPYRDLFSYMQDFKALAPAVHVVPLSDNLFNRCKSNIAWMEATAAGAVVVAPNWEEWQKPGVLTYGSPEQFAEVLRYAVEMREERRAEMVAASRDYIKSNLTLSRVNQQRIDLLNQLVNREPV